jgi:hypothetical protein
VSVVARRANTNIPERDEFRVNGPVVVAGSLTALDVAGSVALGDCYAEVVGVMDYFFNDRLLPRSADDLVTGGADCPALEQGDAVCDDGEDNDADGFTDCEDIGCFTVAACTTGASVVGVQDGTIATDTGVSLAGAVVTAVEVLANCRKNLWVQDPGGAAQYNGVYVFRGSCNNVDIVDLPPEIGVGSVLAVVGQTTEYFDLTELGNAEVSDTGDTATPVVTPVDVFTLAAAATREPYEGMLVRIDNVRVVNAAAGHFSFTVGDTGDELLVGTRRCDARPTVSAGQCLASITGVMHQFQEGPSLLPRSAADVVAGGICN